MENARARNLEALPTTSSVTLPIMNALYKILGLAALAVTCVAAETHVVSFDNRSVLRLWRLWTQGGEANFKPYSLRCGRGTPTLISQNGKVLSTGQRYVSNGPLIGAIA